MQFEQKLTVKLNLELRNDRLVDVFINGQKLVPQANRIISAEVDHDLECIAEEIFRALNDFGLVNFYFHLPDLNLANL